MHSGYNAQRRMLVAGRTNLVTSDSSGRIDVHKLDAFKPEMFTESFEFNAKTYRIFEWERTVTRMLQDGSSEEITLRRIYIWNVTSNRRTSALAYSAQQN